MKPVFMLFFVMAQDHRDLILTNTGPVTDISTSAL